MNSFLGRDSMKLAKVKYSQKREDFGIKGIFQKLPAFLLDWYILRYHAFDIAPLQLAQAEGYTVLLYQPPKEKQKLKQKKNLENLLLFLQQKEVDILLTENEMFLPHIISIATGKMINALFVMEAVKKALKRQQKTLQESHFLLIDGGNFLTQTVLDTIYPHINYLCVYTDRQEDFAQKAEEIYEEYGLRIQFFSGEKNKQFSEANVILNCGCDMENYDYRLQKNAFYFDIAQNKQKLRRLRSRRNDLFFCDGLLLKWDNKTYLSKEIEAILRVREPSVHHFLCSRYDKASAFEITHLLHEKKINVTGFTCFEKRV